MLLIPLVALLATQDVTAHVAPFTKGMYCRNGLQTTDDPNASETVKPLYQLPFEKWWMHGDCINYPPPPGEFLEIPVGKSFTVELATNRAMTTLSNNGQQTSAWPDGKTYPEDYNKGPDGCITEPNLHTQNQSMAAGTVFAISYKSNIKDVTAENLAVFTVLEKTPWKRLATYQVPAALPACPSGGCHCAWGWVPNHCGTPNMYMAPFRCTVTGATSTIPVAAAQPPRWCQGKPGDCVKGSKQMVYYQQNARNNIVLDGPELSPGYNDKLGFASGAQNDIFEGTPSPGSSPSPATSLASSQGSPTPSPKVSSVNLVPSDSTPSSSLPTNVDTTTTTSMPSHNHYRRSTSEGVKLVKKSPIGGSHQRRHSRRLSKESI